MKAFAQRSPALLFLTMVLIFTAGAGVCLAGFLSPKTATLAATQDTVIVKAGDGDTLATLSQRYLHDPGKGWRIALANHISAVTPGQILLIPKKPLFPGGIRSGGLQTVPILVYHAFSQNESSPQLITGTDFEAQIQYLQANEYNVIALDTFMRFRKLKTELPPKSVVITFDDGWRSFYEIGFPILKKYRYPATLFVYTGFIGGNKALSWDHIREMAAWGMDIQCHSQTHRDMTRLADKEDFQAYFDHITWEVEESARRIKEQTGVTCRYFAYPYGEVNPLVIALLQQLGFEAGFTVSRGGNSFFGDRYLVNRTMIYGNQDMAAFVKSLDVFEKRNFQ